MKIVNIHIGGRNFNINCPEGQEEALAQASEQLNLRFNEIQQNASTLPFEQTLTLAALNAIVSLQNKNVQLSQNEQSALKRLKRIAEQFDQFAYTQSDWWNAEALPSPIIKS